MNSSSLVDKYQPLTIADFIGIELSKKILNGLISSPRPCGLLLIGPPGSGKTSIGMAFADELPGSLVHISAQKCDISTLDDLRERFLRYPPKGDYWICLIDEIDQATDKAQLQLLSRLDGTAALKPTFGGGFERGEQPKIIWIMTCNGRGETETEPPTSLLPRFLSRCMMVPCPAANQNELAQYLAKIWKLEGGQATPKGYFEYLADGIGVRDALMRLETDLLAGPSEVPERKPITEVPKPEHHIRIRRDKVAIARSNAALKAWATRRKNSKAA